MAFSSRTVTDRSAYPQEPGPFFLTSGAFEGAPVDLGLDPARWQGAGVEKVDNAALSGEVFLRLTRQANTNGWDWRLPPETAGKLTFELRSRQQIAGTLSVSVATVPGEGLRVSPSTEWANVTLELPANGPDRVLHILLEDEGAWELRNLSCVPFDRDGYATARQAQASAALPGNLLPMSRFPLGLPAGWTIARELSLGDDLQVQPDPLVRGPGGCPSLSLTSSEQGFLRAPAVLAWNENTHRGALWIRGHGSGELCVRTAGGRLLARQTFVARDQGQTVEVSFTPPDLATWITLELSWTTAGMQWWIDAPRIAPATAVSTRVGRGAVELALKVEAQESIFFPARKPAFQYFVSGAASGNRFCWRVLDLQGRVGQGQFELTPEHLETAVCWSPDVNELVPFGSYRLNAWIADDRGTVRSPVAEVIYHRLPEPVSAWNLYPCSAFGVHVLPTRQHLYLAKAIGINWARLHGPGAQINYWSNLEPEPGEWRARPDLLERYRSAGFNVLGKLTGTPRWASGQTQRVHSYFDQFVAPRDWKAWRGYVQKLIETYGHEIDVYEIWNEPWLDKFFSQRVEPGADGACRFIPFEDPAAVYTRMTEETLQAFQASRSMPPLIGLNTTTNRDIDGWVDGDEWTRRLQAAGGLEPVSIFSYHDYNSAPDPRDQFRISQEGFRFALRPVLNEAGQSPKPVWNTEGSPQPGGVSSGLYKHLLPAPDSDTLLLDTVWAEAERVARYFLGQRACGVEKVFFYTLHNFHGFGGPNSFTIFLAPDGSLHPTGAALSVLANYFDGLRFAGETLLPGGRLLRFTADDGRAAEAFLQDRQSPATTLPECTADWESWVDLFGNPVPSNDRIGHSFFRKTVSPKPGRKAT